MVLWEEVTDPTATATMEDLKKMETSLTSSIEAQVKGVEACMLASFVVNSRNSSRRLSMMDVKDVSVSVRSFMVAGTSSSAILTLRRLSPNKEHEALIPIEKCMEPRG